MLDTTAVSVHVVLGFVKTECSHGVVMIFVVSHGVLGHFQKWNVLIYFYRES